MALKNKSKYQGKFNEDIFISRDAMLCSPAVLEVASGILNPGAVAVVVVPEAELPSLKPENDKKNFIVQMKIHGYAANSITI